MSHRLLGHDVICLLGKFEGPICDFDTHCLLFWLASLHRKVPPSPIDQAPRQLQSSSQGTRSDRFSRTHVTKASLLNFTVLPLFSQNVTVITLECQFFISLLDFFRTLRLLRETLALSHGSKQTDSIIWLLTHFWTVATTEILFSCIENHYKGIFLSVLFAEFSATLLSWSRRIDCVVAGFLFIH